MADRQYSLKKANIQFTPLQGVEYKPMEYNMGYLADSLNRMEERERKATEEQSKLDVTFAKIKEQLHQDDETQQWFHDWEKKQRATIEGFAQLGDYSNAIKYASNMASSALDDGELQARIKTNQQYETWKNEINKNNSIEQRTKDRLLEEEGNQYKFDPIFDKNDPSKVISGHDWKASVNPVPHIEHSNIAAWVVQYLPEEQYTWNNLDETGLTSGGSYYRKRAEAIDNVYNALLQSGGQYMQSLRQEYYDDAYEEKKLEEEINNPNLSDAERTDKINRLAVLKEGLYDGSAMRDPVSVAKFKIGKLLENAAYNRTSSTNKKPKISAASSKAVDIAETFIGKYGTGTASGGTVEMSQEDELESNVKSMYYNIQEGLNSLTEDNLKGVTIGG